jgi:hypothetical protein
VPQSLKSTWIALIIAALAVVGSGAFILKSFVQHVFIECKGTLRSVPASELSDSGALKRIDQSRADLEIRYDQTPSKKLYDSYKNVRVVWTRTDAACSCSDVPVKWSGHSYSSPSSLRTYRDDATGLYVVRDSSGSTELAVFRKIDDRGRRFQADRVFEPHNLSMLIFLLSLGALSLAAFLALRAAPYATRMHAWRPATLRHDGLVESETGASLGTMELRSRVPAGPVIVDPAAFEGRDVYREMPILTRRTVGIGTHQRWYEGTIRRLRDARSLAIVAMMTTIFALVARVIGG